MNIKVTIKVATKVRDNYGQMREGALSYLFEIKRTSSLSEYRIDGEEVDGETFKLALTMCELGRVRDS